MNPIAIFKNRRDAGERLAPRVAHRVETSSSTVVLSVDVDGLPVAAAIAAYLQLPLDITMVEPVMSPGDGVIGALTHASFCIEPRILRRGELTVRQLDVLRTRATRELVERRTRLHIVQRDIDLRGVRALIVAHGATTGLALRAVAEAARNSGAESVVAATPLATRLCRQRLEGIVDDLISIGTPLDAHDIRAFYGDLSPLTGKDVRAVLDASLRPPRIAAARRDAVFA